VRGAPAVSVLMPVHNAAGYLHQAIESILNQSFEDFELVLVDDGSDDGSLEIAREFAERDSRIHLIPTPRSGIVAALNTGLATCRGEFIARMDADDVAFPERLAAQVEFLRAHTEHVAVGCGQLLIDPDGAPISQVHFAADHEEIHAEHLQGIPGAISHPASMLRRMAVIDAGGYRADSEYLEDYCLFLRLAESGRLANLPRVLHAYRQHHSNVHFRHYDLQARRATRIVNEARGRAGLPPLAVPAWQYVRTDSAERHRGWALAAAAAGNHRTALKHALFALRADPFSGLSWYVLLRSLVPSGIVRPLRGLRSR
jgi:glycosyltransferase involved in cell wall biosynthesis